MAWTAPATWSTNEIVTAAKMNTHVRDNLAYLKGGAGTVAFDDSITVTDTGVPQLSLLHSSGVYPSYHSISAPGAAAWDINRHPATGTFTDTGKAHASITLDGSGTTGFIQFRTANAVNTFGTERMRVIGSGHLGIGVTVPQGRIHAYDTESGFLFMRSVTSGNTIVVVVPDGAGDVVNGMDFAAVAISSTGSPVYQRTTGSLAPSASSTIWTDASNTLTLRVTAAGQVEVQRTVGSTATFTFALRLLWI
jgi:hypothetical protein